MTSFRKLLILAPAVLCLFSCGSSNPMAGKSFTASEDYKITYEGEASAESMWFEESVASSEKGMRDYIVDIFTTNPSEYQVNGKLNFTSELGVTNLTYEGKNVRPNAINYGEDGGYTSSATCYYIDSGSKGVFVDLSKDYSKWELWSSSGFRSTGERSVSWTVGNGAYVLSNNKLTTTFDVKVVQNKTFTQIAHISIDWTL